MSIPKQIAKHLHDVHFGGNWTTVNLKELLADVSWEQATTQVHGLNSIAALTHHVTYYVVEVAKVMEGASLQAKDEYSWNHPPIASQADWEQLQAKAWANAERFAGLIEQLPERQLNEPFIDEKYGSWYRNLMGIVEHFHYHLGQIAIIKKLVQP